MVIGRATGMDQWGRCRRVTWLGAAPPLTDFSAAGNRMKKGANLKNEHVKM